MNENSLPYPKGAITILLIEDNPGDVRLIQEALKDGKLAVNLHIAKDGIEAIAFLRREGEYSDAPRPDLILLDLNLPKKDGREVLREVKADDELKHIPIVVLTSSETDTDIAKCYNFHANCYVTKPVGLEQFSTIVRTIENFWFTIVKLPKEE